MSASEVKLHVRHWNQWGVNSSRLQLSPTIEYHSPKVQQQSLSNKAYYMLEQSMSEVHNTQRASDEQKVGA